MTILIDTDMEGLTGVVLEPQVNQEGKDFSFGQKMLANDVNAAIDGAVRAGADQVFVSDGHGGGGNMVLTEMDPRARYLLGKIPSETLSDIYSGLDLVFCIGYHAMAGTGQVFPAGLSRPDNRGQHLCPAGVQERL